MSDMNIVCEEIARLTQTYLGLERWKFQETARLAELSNTQGPAVIYNSQWCRVKVEFSEWVPPYQTTSYAVDVYYGRLHAPDCLSTLVWKGEEYWCWHSVSKGLHFLDGQTPEYAAQNINSHDLFRKYQETALYEAVRHNLVESTIRKHAYVWEYYAPRLFELFDLRRPDLWEQYQKFLKDVYNIKGRRPNIRPSLDKVC